MSMAGNAVSGISWHCYEGDPDLVMPKFVGMLQIMNDCSPSLRGFKVYSLFTDMFQNGSSTGELWNLTTDTDGGPVVPPDSGCPECKGIANVNDGSHKVVYTNDFYQEEIFGHFIKPGALRISSNTHEYYNINDPGKYTPGIGDVAIRNGSQDVVIATNDQYHSARVTVEDGSSRYSVTTTLPGNSTAAIVWRR